MRRPLRRQDDHRRTRLFDERQERPFRHAGERRRAGRIPGGSSSGSAAAVSNGLCDFALGTDTGGSVRGAGQPLRPLRHPPDPWPGEPRGLSRPGAVLRHLRIFHPRRRHLRPGRRGAARRGHRSPAGEPAAAPGAGCLRAARQRGAGGARAGSSPDRGRAGAAGAVEVATEGFRRSTGPCATSRAARPGSSMAPMIERYRPPLGPGVADRFEFSRAVTDAQVAEAEVIRAALPEAVHAPPRRGCGADPADHARYRATAHRGRRARLNDYRNNALNLLCLSVLSGLPQVSIPLASRLGAPLGLSLLGPAGSDRSLVGLAQQIAESAARVRAPAVDTGRERRTARLRRSDLVRLQGIDHDTSSSFIRKRRMWRWPALRAVGEGPVWDTARTRSSGSTSRTRASGAIIRRQEHFRIDAPERIGFIALTPDPDVVIAGLQVGPGPLQPPDGRGAAHRVAGARTGRATASTTAMWGRTARSISAPWTMGEEGRPGAFWRWDGKELTQFHSGIVVTNGPAFSPDGRDSLHHRHDRPDGLRPRRSRAAGRRAAPLRPVRGGLGPSGRHGGRCGGLCLGLPLGRLAHHPIRAGRLGRARRAGSDRAGHEMRLRRAGSDHALHHHRRHRPRSASRSDGGASLPGRDRRHPRPAGPFFEG